MTTTASMGPGVEKPLGFVTSIPAGKLSKKKKDKKTVLREAAEALVQYLLDR